MEGFSKEAYYLFFSALASRTRLAIVCTLVDGSKSLSWMLDLWSDRRRCSWKPWAIGSLCLDPCWRIRKSKTYSL